MNPEIQNLIQNVSADGDISVVIKTIQNNYPDADPSKIADLVAESVTSVFQKAKKEIAGDISRNMKSYVLELQGDVFQPTTEIARARDATSNAIWSVISQDRITEFEMEPHFRALTRFFSDQPDFISRYGAPGTKLSLKSLPKALLDFGENETSEEEKVRIQYLRGIALFLCCRFGKALIELEPLARRDLASPGILNLVAESALNIGHFSVALRHFQSALNANVDFESNAEIRRTLLLSNIGACHEELLESERAVLIYREALSTILNGSSSMFSNLVKALVMNNLGFSLMTISDETERGNLEESGELFSEVLQIREDCDDTDPNIASVMFNIAELKRKQNSAGEASYWLDRAEGRMNAFGRPHILNASIYNAKGKFQFDKKEYRKAVESFRRARSILEANFGENSPKIAFTTYSIAQSLEALSDPDAESTLLHARVLALDAIGDEKHPFLRMIDDDLKKKPRRRLFDWA